MTNGQAKARVGIVGVGRMGLAMLKRAGEPAEAARAILFLASDDSSFVIGENLFVDGGTMAMDQTGS